VGKEAVRDGSGPQGAGGAATDEVITALADAKRIAKLYYALTGRPLGITGEIAEYQAIPLLRLALAPVRQPGYDAERNCTAGPNACRSRAGASPENSTQVPESGPGRPPPRSYGSGLI
jgi:hypothetical protein